MIDKDLIMEINGIKISRIQENDYMRIKEIVKDPQIWQYFTLDLSTQAGMLAFRDNSNKNFQSSGGYTFIIEELRSNSICGSTAYINYSKIDHRVEIGNSWLLPRYQGSGVNANVKYMLLYYAFHQLKLHRVEFKTDVLNIKACKALEKIGCVKEGILRSHTLMHDQRYRDTVYYSILASEWPTVKNIYFKDFSSIITSEL